jgi:hypothetical protein
MKIMKSGFEFLKIFTIFLLNSEGIERELFSVFFFFFGRKLFIGFVIVDDEALSFFI